MYSGHRIHRVDSFAAVNKLLCRSDVVEDNSLITLNGYMGIVPADVLRNLKERGCKIYNIHPAPIQLYPELRGIDPQERMYEGIQNREYNYIGVVIHEVDEGVDTGKIVHWVLQMADHSMTKDELYERLHELGTQAWESFFRERMYENGENC
jgi:folate-dependent phosphoribosylglycinamide formyltransferase PurN